jgi:hypothetical protein
MLRGYPTLRHFIIDRYSGQRIMVIGVDNYAYPVPYVEDEEEIFLKTIIPSRRATEIYFGRKSK